MNKLTIFYLFLCSSILSAQNISDAEVYSENGERFYLILNGVQQNQNPETNILVQGLTSSFYHAKVIFENGFPDIEMKYFRVQNVDDQWGKVTYVIKQNKKGEYKMRYRDFVPYAQMPPPSPTVVVVPYHTNQGGVTVSKTTTTQSSRPSGDNVNVGMNIGGVNFGMNVNINDNEQQTETMTTTTTTHTTTSSQVYHQEPVVEAYIPGYTGRVGCQGYPMTAASFSAALSSVRSKDFDRTKLSQAKQIASSNCLTAQQVKEIALLFDFENHRLDFAKFAYSKTVDIDNYFVVSDVFEFEHNVRELNNYIN